MLSKEHRDAILSGDLEGIPLKELGLRGRGEVYLVDATCVRLITRVSRFLRKDAETFMDVLDRASEHVSTPLAGHIIIERAPVCSKARTWLNARDVVLETLYT